MANPFVAGQPYEFDVPVFDTSGKLVSGAAFSAAQISRDGNPMTDLVNTPVEMLEGAGTASPGSGAGTYTVFLLATETAGVVKRLTGKLVVSTAGAQDVFF